MNVILLAVNVIALLINICFICLSKHEEDWYEN